MFATGAIVIMIAAGLLALGLGVYFLLYGGNILGGLAFLALGFAYAYGGRALWQGESWGWGAGVFAGVFFVLFGVLVLPLGAANAALAVVVAILLYRERAYYGMVRVRPQEEEARKAEMRTERMRNPDGLHCPHCGSTALWVAADGSAWCDACKRGTISLRAPA